jgi:hypothetical protein
VQILVLVINSLTLLDFRHYNRRCCTHAKYDGQQINGAVRSDLLPADRVKMGALGVVDSFGHSRVRVTTQSLFIFGASSLLSNIRSFAVAKQ